MDATHAPENWLPVVGFENSYEVSDLGRVRNMDRLVLTPSCAERYPTVGLWLGNRCSTKRVHLLVLTAFVGPRLGDLEACHNDGDPTNNRADNLRWDTKSANASDSLRHGTNAEARKTRCKRGHEFTAENTRYTTTGGRQCRECIRLLSGATARRGPYRTKRDY